MLLVLWVVVLAEVGLGTGGRELPKNPKMPEDDETEDAEEDEDEGGDEWGRLLPLVLAVARAMVSLVTGRRAMMTLKKCVGTWISRGNVPTA